MTTTAGVGFSSHKNAAEAGRQAAADAMKHAGTDSPDLVIVFATVGYDQQLLINSIRKATSGAPLSGCSGEGVITRDIVAETNFGVSVMALRSDELQFRNFFVREIGQDIAKAGKELAAGIRPHLTDDSRACFLFADGLVFNFDPFLAAFEQTLGIEKQLPILGGLAADNWASKKTYQYHDDQVFSEGISCILMSGVGKVAWGVNHGCVPVGKERTITKCSGNVIYEIDGMPALEALKEYFDDNWKNEWNKTSLNLCLGFKAPQHFREHYDEYIVRYMMSKDDRDGHVKIQSEVNEGDRLWMVRRDKDLIRDGAKKISMMIDEQTSGNRPKFVLQFECVGRGKVVLREQEKLEIIRSLQKDIGDSIPWMGFYTYGEIGPVSHCNSFHNFTSVVAAVY
ncbi:MAG TPA: FIST N-terminal domain-containing protein [Dissulfurispiraceae bacterium]|nr:FIST N-terminal domain-containing protein [Dissulfurispiraceae bacterium]